MLYLVKRWNFIATAKSQLGGSLEYSAPNKQLKAADVDKDGSASPIDFAKM